MLYKAIRYKSLAIIFGVLCLLWALYSAFQVATMHVYQGGDASQQYFYLIQTAVGLAFSLIIAKGILWYVALSIFLLGFGSQRVRIAYWSIQAVIWLVGITLWFQTAHILYVIPQFPPNLLWIIVSACCSLILLVLYKPTISLLTAIIKPFKRDVKEEPTHVYEPLQMHSNRSAEEYNPHEDGY